MNMIKRILSYILPEGPVGPMGPPGASGISAAGELRREMRDRFEHSRKMRCHIRSEMRKQSQRIFRLENEAMIAKIGTRSNAERSRERVKIAKVFNHTKPYSEEQLRASNHGAGSTVGCCAPSVFVLPSEKAKSVTVPDKQILISEEVDKALVNLFELIGMRSDFGRSYTVLTLYVDKVIAKLSECFRRPAPCPSESFGEAIERLFTLAGISILPGWHPVEIASRLRDVAAILQNELVRCVPRPKGDFRDVVTGEPSPLPPLVIRDMALSEKHSSSCFCPECAQEKAAMTEDKIISAFFKRAPAVACCGYQPGTSRPYPVYWNEYNKVVQCHNCGQVWEPRNAKKEEPWLRKTLDDAKKAYAEQPAWARVNRDAKGGTGPAVTVVDDFQFESQITAAVFNNRAQDALKNLAESLGGKLVRKQVAVDHKTILDTGKEKCECDICTEPAKPPVDPITCGCEDCQAKHKVGPPGLRKPWIREDQREDIGVALSKESQDFAAKQRGPVRSDGPASNQDYRDVAEEIHRC